MPNLKLIHGVLRISAGEDRTFAQTVVIRYGLSSRQVVVELSGGATLDRYSSYLKRSRIKRVELSGFEPSDQVKNSTSLPTRVCTVSTEETGRLGHDPCDTWISA